jgi:DNA-binding NarL/FixJ family response regulator
MTASHDVAIVCVSASAADALVDHAMRTGADGYVVKPFQLPQILTAIKVALYQHRTRHGEAPGADAADHFATALYDLQAALADETIWLDHDGVECPMAMTTAREKEVIRGLIAYRRISVVADVLGISVHTARNHLKSVFRKLDVHSQDELLRYMTQRWS